METNAITKNNKNPSNYNILQKPCSGSTYIARRAPGVAGLPVPPKPASLEQQQQQQHWFYDHPDGTTRRVLPTWMMFPSGTLLELYTLWHLGDPQNRIYPMKTFTTYDVSFRGKRSRMSLSDTRVLTMKKKLDIVVEEVSKAGGSIIDPNNITSQAELEELFKLALKGFNIPLTTPQGRDRDIFRLKWRTFAKFNLNLNSNEEGKTKEQEGGMTTKLPAPAPAPAPVQQGGHDNWLYEHGDGVKRKVPST